MTDGNSTTESSLLVSEHNTGTDTQSLQASTAVTSKSDGHSEGLGTDISNSDLSLLELSDEESTGTEVTFTNSDASEKVTTPASEELLKARSDSLQETKNNEELSGSRSLKVAEVASVSFSSSCCPAQTPSPRLKKPHLDSAL